MYSPVPSVSGGNAPVWPVAVQCLKPCLSCVSTISLPQSAGCPRKLHIPLEHAVCVMSSTTTLSDPDEWVFSAIGILGVQRAAAGE